MRNILQAIGGKIRDTSILLKTGTRSAGVAAGATVYPFITKITSRSMQKSSIRIFLYFVGLAIAGFIIIFTSLGKSPLTAKP